jgi:hypothetical protein
MLSQEYSTTSFLFYSLPVVSTMHPAQLREKITLRKFETFTSTRLTDKSVAKDFLKKGEL